MASLDINMPQTSLEMYYFTRRQERLKLMQIAQQGLQDQRLKPMVHVHLNNLIRKLMAQEQEDNQQIEVYLHNIRVGKMNEGAQKFWQWEGASLVYSPSWWDILYANQLFDPKTITKGTSGRYMRRMAPYPKVYTSGTTRQNRSTPDTTSSCGSPAPYMIPIEIKNTSVLVQDYMPNTSWDPWARLSEKLYLIDIARLRQELARMRQEENDNN